MDNKEQPKMLERFDALWQKECALREHLESVDYADPDGMREMAAVQQERARAGKELGIGIIG